MKMKKRFPILIMAILIIFAAGAQAGKGRVNIGVLPVPPALSMTIKFVEPSGNNILNAEETGKLVLTVKNSGRGDAVDCRAQIAVAKQIRGLSFEHEVALGTISAGETRVMEISLTADEELPTNVAALTIALKEANGFEPAPVKLAFRTQAFAEPKLIVADMGIHDAGGNSRVEPMEMVELTVRVQNVGQGDARGVAADVVAGNNVFIGGDAQTHFELGPLPSGKFKDFKFMFYTNTRIANGEKIPLTVTLSEARPRFNTQKELALTMNAPQRKTEEVFVAGKDAPKTADIAVAGGLSVDVDANIPQGVKAGKYDIAVVIGNKSYAEGIPQVAYADRDARIMKEYVLHTMGFEEGNVIYAEDATLSKLNEIFGTEQAPKGRLFNMVKRNVSRVFVYYGGHGAPDLESGDAFFVPVDGNPEYIRASGYRLQTFYDNLAKLPAKKITVVLDACFSGNSDKGMLFKGISPAIVKVKKEYRGPKGAVLMTSASTDQVSAWYPEKRHSLFTYFFLKGLQGAADQSGDGKITVGELSEYLREHVPYMARRLKGVEQQPVIMGNPGDVLAVLKK
jgi:hypothetical protein